MGFCCQQWGSLSSASVPLRGGRESRRVNLPPPYFLRQFLPPHSTNYFKQLSTDGLSGQKFGAIKTPKKVLFCREPVCELLSTHVNLHR